MTELVDTWLHHQGRPIHGRTSRSGPHPDRPTIVLIHGLVVSGRYLLPLAEALSGSFDVHVPDLPGFGRSPGPKRPLSIIDLADAVIGWMDAAHLPDAVLVANSFGCQIALEAAVRHSDRVAALVLQGPSTDARARSTAAQLKRFTKNAVHESPSLYPLVLLDYLKTAKSHLVTTFRAAVADPIEERLMGVRARTLIISGERDPISPPDWCRRMALEMANAEHAEIEGGSHTMVYSEPRLVARLIQHFVLEERLHGNMTAKVLLGDPELPEFVADIDSSTVMLRATARGLQEEAFDNLGLSPRATKLKRIYAAAGFGQSYSPRRLDRVDAEVFRKWVVDGYPTRSHPAIFIGANNGAIAHLATAMNAPWLPQSFLVPVRQGVIRSQDLVREMEQGRALAAPLLAANADVSVVHVHDPSRALLRVRLLELGTTYRTFIHRCLDPGGTIYVADCTKKSPQVKLSDRLAFQPGSGGLRSPDPDHSGPHAEWGFDPAMMDDILELAKKRDYRVVQISYEEPDDLSPLVAETMRDWYRDMGWRSHHLLVCNSLLMDPWWAIRTGSVPFWTAVNSSESVERVRAYLERSERWRSIDLMLFSRGTDAPVDVERWQDVIRLVGTGALLGIDTHQYPRDFEIIGRYSRALRQQVARRDWPSRALEVACLDRHLFERPDGFHASERTVSSRDVRKPVTLRPATPALISLPNW